MNGITLPNGDWKPLSACSRDELAEAVLRLQLEVAEHKRLADKCRAIVREHVADCQTADQVIISSIGGRIEGGMG